MTHIVLIATGGTIASAPVASGAVNAGLRISATSADRIIADTMVSESSENSVLTSTKPTA